jgi:hypothetical protein
MFMQTKDIKKGSRVQLRNGYTADTLGSARGHTTMCKVYGIVTEMGSVYTTDIEFVKVDGVFQNVEYSEGQLKAQRARSRMGF